jgi:hypothetical protein
VDGECLGDMVGISNFDKNDVIYVDLHSGHRFLGRAPISVWTGLNVISGHKAFLFKKDGIKIAGIKATVKFVGAEYNSDYFVDKILNWKQVYQQGEVNELVHYVTRLNRVEDNQILMVSKVQDIFYTLRALMVAFS